MRQSALGVMARRCCELVEDIKLQRPQLVVSPRPILHPVSINIREEALNGQPVPQLRGV